MRKLNFTSSKQKVIKIKFMIVNSIIIVLFFSIMLFAYSTGITGVTKKSNNSGCICHGLEPSSTVIVSINGPDSLSINQTADYTITISGGPLNAAGTNIAVSSGILSPASSDLRLQNSELTHVSPKGPVSGFVTFNFKYTAPSTTGEQTIYANGNSVNFNGQNLGDEWNFAPNKTVQVSSVISAAEKETNIFTFNLKQNYPNPFNPATTIEYSVQEESFININIYDLTGRQIKTLVNERKSSGNYSIIFNAGNLPTGVYFYRMQAIPEGRHAGNFVSTKKFILIK